MKEQEENKPSGPSTPGPVNFSTLLKLCQIKKLREAIPSLPKGRWRWKLGGSKHRAWILGTHVGSTHAGSSGNRPLGIAHFDSVYSGPGYVQPIRNFLEQGNVVFCPQVDDRLGVYTLLYMLNGEYDILLTDHEEKGKTTGEDFAKAQGSHPYTWMFMFDRGGKYESHAMYHYLYSELAETLRKEGERVESGLSSCIGKMEKLGIPGVNWNTEYYEYHGPLAYFHYDGYMERVASFQRFFDKYHSTRFKMWRERSLPTRYEFPDKRTSGSLWDQGSPEMISETDTFCFHCGLWFGASSADCKWCGEKLYTNLPTTTEKATNEFSDLRY